MNSPTKKTPWHLWLIGVVSLLWNSGGAFDFIMTQTQNEKYMSSFTEQQLEFFYGFPAWVVVFWAIAVFGSLIGSILLLARSKFAVPVFGASLFSFIVTAIQNYGMSNAMEVTGAFGMIFSVVIFVIVSAQVWYSRAMRQAGVLK